MPGVCLGPSQRATESQRQRVLRFSLSLCVSVARGSSSDWGRRRYTCETPMTAAGVHGRPPDRVLTAQRLLAVCVAFVIAVTTASSGQTPAVVSSPATEADRAF